MDDILPPSLMPAYFQPPSDSYIVDIAIGTCNLFNKKSSTCGIPKSSYGLYGDVDGNGGWSRVEKDLMLGSHWTAKSYLNIKKISSEYYERNRDKVIVDVTVANSKEDCAIKGNKKCYPKSIITELNMKHSFDENDLTALKELNKYEPVKLTNEIYQDENEPKKKQSGEDKEKEAAREKEPTNNASSVDRSAKDELSNNEIALGDDDTFKKHPITLRRRKVENSHHDLVNYMRIPPEKEIKESGWVKKDASIWVKYGEANDNAVSGIDILFGADALDPRPNWNILKHPLENLGFKANMYPRLTIRRGPKVDYSSKTYTPALKFRSDGKFKVLQVADLHFSTGPGECRDPVPESTANGCQADPRTLNFINRVLDIEAPDFVVMTGDQIFGAAAPDPETALFKAVSPFIARKIPYAITLGNHDDESILSREQVMKLASSLPYLVAVVGPEGVDGFGNYAVVVGQLEGRQHSAVFYFMDSHSRSKNPKVNPGYDWFKESQVEWLGLQSVALIDQARDKKFMSMAFFHIPLPEYRNRGQPMVGQSPEGVTAPKLDSGMREALGSAGVQAVSVGHDHANDYCLLDANKNNALWLCYGGGAGEGGYGGYGGYIRRVRVFELDGAKEDIVTWKRAENNPSEAFDKQLIVSQGKVLEHSQTLV